MTSSFWTVISRAPGLKLVVQTLLSSLRPIGHIVVICCTFFIIFGILGVQVTRQSHTSLLFGVKASHRNNLTDLILPEPASFIPVFCFPYKSSRRCRNLSSFIQRLANSCKLMLLSFSLAFQRQILLLWRPIGSQCHQTTTVWRIVWSPLEKSTVQLRQFRTSRVQRWWTMPFDRSAFVLRRHCSHYSFYHRVMVGYRSCTMVSMPWMWICNRKGIITRRN